MYSQSTTRCFNGDVYSYDSCGNRGDRLAQCNGGQVCVEGNGANQENASCQCQSQVTSACFDQDVYWFNSCGLRENIKTDCALNERCEGGACIALGCQLDSVEDNDSIQTASPVTLGEFNRQLNLCDDSTDIFSITLEQGQEIDIETYSTPPWRLTRPHTHRHE